MLPKILCIQVIVCMNFNAFFDKLIDLFSRFTFFYCALLTAHSLLHADDYQRYEYLSMS